MNIKIFEINWTEMKVKIDSGHNYYHHSLKNICYVYAYKEPFTYRCKFQSDIEEADFTDNYESKSNKPQIPETSDGKPIYATDKGEGSFDTLISPDWTSDASTPWVIEPAADKKLEISKSEVQFSHDVTLQTTEIPVEFYFDVWVYNPIMDEELDFVSEDATWYPGKEGEPFRNQLRFLYTRTTFKSLKDVFNYGNEHFTMNVGVDGLTSGITTVQFNYDQKIILDSSKGMQVRFSTLDNREMGGEFCTVSVVVREVDI